jgi:SAM-dependent methyltransferase
MVMDEKRKAYWKEGYQDPDKVAQYDAIRFLGGRKSWNNKTVWKAVRKALRRAGGGKIPATVIDAPAGTGRFTRELQDEGIRLVNLDLSGQMLGVLRKNYGPGLEVIGNLNQPPMAMVPDSAVLVLRLMQHLESHERVEAMRGLTRISPWAVISFYPARHIKHISRRLRKALGLFKREMRRNYPNVQIIREAEEAGWEVVAIRPAARFFSDNVVVLLKNPVA